jgi:hypothetical protein
MGGRGGRHALLVVASLALLFATGCATVAVHPRFGPLPAAIGPVAVTPAAITPTAVTSQLSDASQEAPAVVAAEVATVDEQVAPQPDLCSTAFADVEAAGIHLPARFEFRCPADISALTPTGHRWGLACADSVHCPQQPYVAVDLTGIGDSAARVHYVVAHEICHAAEYQAGRPYGEDAADACAAAHGFPRV